MLHIPLSWNSPRNRPLQSQLVAAALGLLIVASGHASATAIPPDDGPAVLAIPEANDAPEAAEAGGAPQASAGALQTTACDTLFGEGDPRLFEFVDTSKAVDFSTYQGRQIGNITYLTLPIFNAKDPEEDRVLYRAANYVHIETREKTLRKQVLLREGDVLDSDLVRQSERILRANSYLYDAMILPARTCGDQVDLLVVVRDTWTLKPALNFGHVGGQSTSSFEFSEDNLLGNGQSLSLSLDKSPARTSTVLSYTDKHLFDGRTILQIKRANSSDGVKNGFLLEKPFYEFNSRHSAGLDLHDETLTESTTTGGLTTNSYEHRKEDAEIFLGWSDGQMGDAAERWRFGITRQADDYNSQRHGSVDPLPGNRLLVYPWLELEHVENNFVTMSNVSRMFRIEDINVGTGWRLRGGMANHQMGSEQDGVVLQIDWHDTLGSGRHHLLRNKIYANMFINEADGTRRDSLYGYQARYDYFIDENDRWLAGIKLDIGEQLSPENQLKTGGENGLLGYPDSWQRGDRRAVFGVERRHFHKVHPLNLFRIATAAFLEAGRAWDSTGIALQSNNTLVDIGIGLRLNSSKARSNNILQFNIAVPLTDGATTDRVQWSIFAGESF